MKQDEIREGVANLEIGIGMVIEPDDTRHSFAKDIIGYENADKILSYLHSQGVVIKNIERKPYCSHFEYIDFATQERTFHLAEMENHCPLIKAGYVAVEPLIKEE